MTSPCLLTNSGERKTRMELNNSDAAVCSDSIDAQNSTPGPGEIDLYDELTAFAELSPDEQLRSVDLPGPSAEAEDRSSDVAGEHPFREPVITHPPIESETAVAETEAATAAEAGESTSPERLLPEVSIEPVEAETAGAGTTPSTEYAEEESSPELLLTQPSIGLVQSEPAAAEPRMAPAEEAEEDKSPEEVVTDSPIEAVKSVTAEPAESPCGSDASDAPVATSEVRPPLVEGPRPSGPLSGFNLPPEIVYTGALSRGVCLACGAESSADDLFCLACGVFIDEIASDLPSSPRCAECEEPIEADEIFCPMCGSVVPAQR